MSVALFNLILLIRNCMPKTRQTKNEKNAKVCAETCCNFFYIKSGRLLLWDTQLNLSISMEILNSAKTFHLF